ncbi:MAG TPA: hypothetical protein VMQ46_01920, partial [Acidimicrobiia bacterium]|nr:hypothetical protein [Acidimicrobiia bacterium]
MMRLTEQSQASMRRVSTSTMSPPWKGLVGASGVAFQAWDVGEDDEVWFLTGDGWGVGMVQ